MYAHVALQLPIPPLTYKVPADMVSRVVKGSAVRVNLRKKSQLGFITEIFNELPEAADYKINPIEDIADEIPAIPPSLLQFFLWISEYYHYPLGEVIASSLPPKLENPTQSRFLLNIDLDNLAPKETKELQSRGGKKWHLLKLLEEAPDTREVPEEFRATLKKLMKDGLVKAETVDKELAFLRKGFAGNSEPPALSAEQAAALFQLKRSLEQTKFETFLLEGVTGSGKTEIYLGAAQAALNLGKNVLMMVPEIALTPQLYGRVTARLGHKVAILHSGLTDRERSEQWHLIRRGATKVVLGARSTIFSPIENLGLVIVDEEHEGAFKQEDRLRYNARDLAIVRGMQSNATVLLGSATPSLESFYNVKTGKYKHLELKGRVTGNPLPAVTVVDLRKERPQGSFSPRLIKEIQNSLSQKQQVLLFLNRRGYSSFLLCADCGEVPSCPNCSVSLTYYQKRNSLQCHYCNHQELLTPTCKACGSTERTAGTLGTEQVEDQAKALFPEARIARVDGESTQKRDSLENLLLQIAQREVDIIIGTQMIAKGHDFPGIQLVAILHADSSVNIPDFRSSERSFQLFTQVAGRAGRGTWAGKVFLQAHNPDHQSIVYSSQHDFRAFAETELSVRQAFQYPPFVKLARILVTDLNERAARETAERIQADLIKHGSVQAEKMDFLGPAPAVISKIQNRYRWNILIKSPKATTLQALLKARLPIWRKALAKSTVLQVDVDPLSLL